MNLFEAANDPANRFFVDWIVVYLAGGGAVTLAGFVAGFLIWGRSRHRADAIDLAYRKARQDYEQRNEEFSRLKRKVLYREL